MYKSFGAGGGRYPSVFLRVRVGSGNSLKGGGRVRNFETDKQRFRVSEKVRP